MTSSVEFLGGAMMPAGAAHVLAQGRRLGQYGVRNTSSWPQCFLSVLPTRSQQPNVLESINPMAVTE